MASLSLPRVLQLKKNSLDAEREQFEKFQTLAIQKAINSVETPVKEKHVRSTIIGTFQEQSAVTFWTVALRLPLQDNRIVAWKFCHVTHKVLREGHPAALDDSQRHIEMIHNLGKLWVHLREGYGRLIHLYCNLLVCKLKFHARNPRFPGNMLLTADELDSIAENDVNNYFQICVELFDYMDDILNLQAAVFDSLGNARANSMTASGQCRLAALIPCAQDSSHIYDCNVRLLFRLHASLPADTLQGHRERFRQQFKKLSQFYKHASSLQYYRNLLTLPVLPSNPPNFLLQSDFGTYVAPVVSIPEPPPDEVDAVGSLIDTSDTVSLATTPDNFEILDTRATPSPQPDPLVERDRLIDHLQNELRRMRNEVSQMVQERNSMLGSMKEHCTRLEAQLQDAQFELEEEKQKAEQLSAQTPEIQQKLTQTEEKARVTDEKFQKLKGAYTQLREEHIALIRQKAEVDKMTTNLKATAAQHESAKMALQQQLNDRIKDVELLQQSVSSSEEIEAYKTEILNLRADLEQSRQKEVELETVRASLEALQIEHKTATTEQQEHILKITNELKDTAESLEEIKQQKNEKEIEFSRVKEELVSLRENSGNEYKKVVEQKEAALKQVEELKQQYQQEKEDNIQYINVLQTQLTDLQQKIKDAEVNLAIECDKLNEKFSLESLNYNKTLNIKDNEIKDLYDKIIVMEKQIENMKTIYEDNINEKETHVKTLHNKISQLTNDNTTNEKTIQNLKDQNQGLLSQIQEITDKSEQLKKKVTNLTENLDNKGSEFIEIENTKNKEINDLKNKKITMESEINNFQMLLKENHDLLEKSKLENELLSKSINEFKDKIEEKNKEACIINLKINEITSAYEKLKLETDLQTKENECQLIVFKDKLKRVTETKEEDSKKFKRIIEDKDEQIISLNAEIDKLSSEISKLQEESKETYAKLELAKNELISFKQDHKNIVQSIENNLQMNDQEMKKINENCNELNEKYNALVVEKNNLFEEFANEKEVLENKIRCLEVAQRTATEKCINIENEKQELTNKWQNEIKEIKLQYESLKDANSNEIETLRNKISQQEVKMAEQAIDKVNMISRNEKIAQEYESRISEIENFKNIEKRDFEKTLSMKEQENQMLEARLQHTDNERLNKECELQDLLQHSTLLETDLAAVKKQLEETQRALDRQTSRLVSCAGETALAVSNGALAAVDRGSVQDTTKIAVEEAINALEQLSKTEIKGNEESVARNAILIAHNTATLAAYITEVSNLSPDMVVSEKLNTECRDMLSSTIQCLESIKSGSMKQSACVEARGRVGVAARAAAAADRGAGSGASVDDELADMDRAIEHAALQIESLLAASRAGDTGVKLEVNGKILDACTTLMEEVKILVRDARKLQNELGDPTTRQKMYRKNPQWSEGLISAAKAVVFAAKLLVSSADEAVSGAGRVEGVSAAAHEVAGSTAQLAAASRARAPLRAPAAAALAAAARRVPHAAGAVLAAVRQAALVQHQQEALDTSTLTLTATRRLEMESKVRSLELETALEGERLKLAALRKRHYQLAQLEENGGITNGTNGNK